MEQKLSSLVSQDYTIVGGVDSVVEVLNTVDRGTEKHIMENLEIEEPELADLSIDVALHPNDPGYQRMADEIINAFEKVFEAEGGADTLAPVQSQ